MRAYIKAQKVIWVMGETLVLALIEMEGIEKFWAEGWDLLISYYWS